MERATNFNLMILVIQLFTEKILIGNFLDIALQYEKHQDKNNVYFIV